MAENRDQHFNPQFYLRNFSADKNGRSIHLYNIARAQCVFGANFAGQCARPYFYGKDGRLETGLGMLETAAAPVFRRMISERKVPPRHSPDHGLLGSSLLSSTAGRKPEGRKSTRWPTSSGNMFSGSGLNPISPKLSITCGWLREWGRAVLTLSPVKRGAAKALLHDLH
jgi:Protein of unknown function (DUF4238)